MSKKSKHDDVSAILFRYDPANTSCKENDATDEYDHVALSIVNDNYTASEAFDIFFDGYYNKNALDKAEEEISKIL